MNIENLFESNKDLSEDEVVMIFHSEGELSLKECQNEYKRLAIGAGIVKTSGQRKAEWEDSIEALNLTMEEGINEARAIGATLEITSATVTRYLKAIALERGITLPVMSAKSNPTWGKVVDAFDEEEALTGIREDIVAKINEVGEYEDIKKAGSYYNKLRKHFGWEAPASMSSQLCDWFTESVNNNELVDNQQIVEKAVEIGMTEGSGKYYVGVFKLTNEILESLK